MDKGAEGREENIPRKAIKILSELKPDKNASLGSGQRYSKERLFLQQGTRLPTARKGSSHSKEQKIPQQASGGPSGSYFPIHASGLSFAGSGLLVSLRSWKWSVQLPLPSSATVPRMSFVFTFCPFLTMVLERLQ